MKNDFRTKLLKEHAGNEALLNVQFAGIPAKEIYKGMNFRAGKGHYTVMDVGVTSRPDPSVNWVPAPHVHSVIIQTSAGWFYEEEIEWLPNTLGEGMKVATPKGEEGVIINIQPNRACQVEVAGGVVESYTEYDLKRLTVYDELLKRFVSTDRTLAYYLRSPHKQDGFVYASDRYIMICIPADETHAMNLNYKSDFIKSPAGYNFQNVFDQAMRENGIVPEIKMDIGACEMVLQMVPTEPVYAKCAFCKGEGTIHCCACGHNAKCHDCKGSGKGTEIVGKEYDFSNNVIEINGARIGPEYANLLLAVAKLTGELIHVAISPKRGGVNVFKSGAITIAIVNTFVQADSIYHFPHIAPFESACSEAIPI